MVYPIDLPFGEKNGLRDCSLPATTWASSAEIARQYNCDPAPMYAIVEPSGEIAKEVPPPGTKSSPLIW